ncbi:hypothetical protein [Gordonia sp. ABSL49_1]|nr:hypothetical protein [Gordonia sp. ABSL49_1]MCH5645184.1 hypothetical protein [Gordonia sp. ABSL49_1]
MPIPRVDVPAPMAARAAAASAALTTALPTVVASVSPSTVVVPADPIGA